MIRLLKLKRARANTCVFVITVVTKHGKQGDENMKISQMIEWLEVIKEMEGDLELNINIHGNGTTSQDIQNGVLIIENYGK